MDSKKANKISEIVRLRQILIKWKKLANSTKTTGSNMTKTSTTGSNGSSTKSSSINKLVKKTLSFSESSNASSNDAVPKGFLTVCVGKDLQRFIIPTEYLGHQAFGILLRQAEEEFGFQQKGVLKLPCEVPLFQKILKMVQDKREVFFLNDFGFNNLDNHELHGNDVGCFSPDSELTPISHRSQLCT